MLPRVAYALVAVFAAACATAPSDPYAVAESALAAQDLPEALRAFDAVPVAHARYPQARAQAAAVERDMRRCHELVLQAMLLRAEWRDESAMQALRAAHAVWPTMPGVDVLLAATAARGRALHAEAPSTTVALPTAVAPAAPAGETAMAAAPAAELVPPVGAEVAAALARIEATLARGDAATAHAQLVRLHATCPDDVRVGNRLARFLHQRALVRYGEGDVRGAADDWQRVLELAPQHAQARAMLATALGEAR